MAMSVGENKKGSISEMNVVPLIDILLVLLIIFMVISPLTPKGMDALIPQPSTAPQTESPVLRTVVVQVLADAKSGAPLVKINDENSSWELLGARMNQIFKERAEKVAFVKGDNDVMFTDVARAIDIMRGAGVEKVGLVTSKLELER